MEKLNLLESSNGTVLHSEIVGAVKMKVLYEGDEDEGGRCRFSALPASHMHICQPRCNEVLFSKLAVSSRLSVFFFFSLIAFFRGFSLIAFFFNFLL